MSPIIRNASDHLRPSDMDKLATILKRGGIAVIPVDTVYGLIGKAFEKEVFDRIDAIKGDRHIPYAVAFANTASIEGWVGGLTFRQRRFISGLVPGPLTFILKPGGKVPEAFRYHSTGIGVRVSSDPLLPRLCSLVDWPIWATSANHSGDPAPSDYVSIKHSVLQAVDMAIDSGPTLFCDASTVADLRTKRFSITRKGPWLSRVEAAIKKSDQPLSVMLLCTGNICRSPLAAELLKSHNIPHIDVVSGGLDAMLDAAATAEMVEVADEWGINLRSHRSSQATIERLRSTDIIITATPEHRERVIGIVPGSERKTFLMAETIGEQTIPDPYRRGGEQYSAVANMIRNSMEGWKLRLEKIVSDEYEPAVNESANGDSTTSD